MPKSKRKLSGMWTEIEDLYCIKDQNASPGKRG